MDVTKLNAESSLMNRLIGLEIIRVIAGGAAGSIIGIELGRLNSSHDHWYLGIQCSWRLEDNSVPLTSSDDDNATAGPMLKGLGTLIGQTITNLEISPPAYDLTIVATEGKRLLVFCDIVRDDCCWYAQGPRKEQVSVKPAGTITFRNATQ